MLSLESFFKQIPKDAWIYNYVASFVFYIIGGFNNFMSLILFPITIALVLYVLTYVIDGKEYTQYLGFYPLERDTIAFIICLICNYILWHLSFGLLVIALALIIWQNVRRA